MKGDFYVNVYRSDDLMLQVMEGKEQVVKVSNKFDAHHDMLGVNVNDEIFCNDCEYAIEVHALQDSFFYLQVETESRPLMLQSHLELRNVAMKDERHSYFYKETNGFYLKVEVLQGRVGLAVKRRAFAQTRSESDEDYVVE